MRTKYERESKDKGNEKEGEERRRSGVRGLLKVRFRISGRPERAEVVNSFQDPGPQTDKGPACRR